MFVVNLLVYCCVVLICWYSVVVFLMCWPSVVFECVGLELFLLVLIYWPIVVCFVNVLV